MRYARATLDGVRPYRPEPPGCAIDLSDNTNLFGTPPRATAVLRSAADAGVTRYPEAYSLRLRSALARYANVAPDQLTTGCGSDDLIDCAIRAFVEPGQRVAHADPSFSMVPVFTRVNGAEPIGVPLSSTGALDPLAVLATRAQLIYLCAPNNPTGTSLAAATVRRILDEAPGVVLLDEAYVEFADHSWVQEAVRRPNVLVTRTLSKAFGLAGLRVGYILGASELITAVDKARGPYKVSSLAERAAEVAVQEDLAWVRANAGEAVAIRQRLNEGLQQLGLSPLPSQANFVFVPVPGAAAVAGRMRERGVQVRAFEGLTTFGDALRIGCGPWPLMAQALGALKEALR